MSNAFRSFTLPNYYDNKRYEHSYKQIPDHITNFNIDGGMPCF